VDHVDLAQSAGLVPAGDDPALASLGVQSVLALEIPTSSRAAEDRSRITRWQMSKENSLWGAPRIHGELLKLGFEVAESTVSKYMIKHRGPPSQTWRACLRNHADAIAAVDLCLVPTLTFECLFAFLVTMVADSFSGSR
jgi:hypothetical protein